MQVLCLIHKYWTRLKKVTIDKSSSLFCQILNDEEKIIEWTLGANVIKRFFTMSVTKRPNKLERLSPGKLPQPDLITSSKAGAHLFQVLPI